MRKLGDTELYNLRMGPSEQQAIGQATRLKLNQNIGIIAPEQIEIELTQLTAKKSVYTPLLQDALSLYKMRGLLRLFNLGSTERGRSPIPTFMPFVITNGRNRAKEGNTEISAQNALDRVIFMNMFRIGSWSADESKYNGLVAATDLYACLESGTIMYKMLVQGMSSKVFQNKVIVEILTKIYTNIFLQVMVRAKTHIGNNGSEEFATDAACFVIAKFFLKYVLKGSIQDNEDIINSYAMLCIKNRSSRSALESYDETNMFDYESLSGFLKTFGMTFYHEPVTLMEFEDNWLKYNGESAAFAVEYAPYFIHMLIAGLHGSSLGGTLRIGKRVTEYNKLGLPKLYSTLVSTIK